MEESNPFTKPLYNLKLNNFPTHLCDFQQTSKKIDDTVNFKNRFKTFYNFITKFDETLDNEINPKLFQNNSSMEELNLIDIEVKKLVENNLTLMEAECPPVFLKQWNGLNTYFNGKTKIHIILTLTLLYIDIEIIHNDINEYEKNILYWALMLHDIAKHVILNERLRETFELKE